MKTKKITALLLALSMLPAISSAYAADTAATRGYVAQTLLNAADDYNPSVKKSDIIKGYEDGLLHEERTVTRAEALVMLKRAFGTLPTPTGHNARVAIPKERFTDIPEWAKSELSNVFDSGIVAGTAQGVFSPDEPVTEDQMRLFIERVYSLFGSNEKDDFYASVNKNGLETLSIKPGRTIAGTLFDLGDATNEQINSLIKEIVSSKHEYGSKEQKISDLYNNILNKDARSKAGIEPIKKYLELIDTSKTTDDLIKIQNIMSDKLCTVPYMGFSLTVDLKDSTKYMLYFDTVSPALQKDVYEDETSEQAFAYIKYIKTLFTLIGETEENAERMARECFSLERTLSKKQLDPADQIDVDKIYNIFTLQQIKDLFPYADIDSVFLHSGFKASDNIVIQDVEMTKAFSELFNNDNIDALKAYAKFSLAAGWGGALNEEFIDASQNFSNEFLGTEGKYSDEELASMNIQNLLPDYIGEIYSNKYFSEEAKKDVENMTKDIIDIYRLRLQNITWMSDTTKAKAINKLDKISVKIGYPDSWETYLDDVDIRPVSAGGSYFENLLNIAKAQEQEIISLQNEPVDKTEWAMYPYTVNACYSPTSNDITFPAGILQSPLYDINASYEQNLGGIGYIIAHEITHAFDNSGAKYDENGNASDWWTPEDYDAFQKLCDKMTAFYEGQEGIPGIPMDGTLTLSENIADQGAAACITEVASRLENPDFKVLYESMAHCWISTASREYYKYASSVDYHSTEKLRINRVLVNCDEFYEAFGITENDGMYVKPEDRVKIW